MMATRKQRVPVVFTDDPFQTPFTFDEVRAATAAQLPGELLLRASERVRREKRGLPPAEVMLAQRQRRQCPHCKLAELVGNIHTVTLSNGSTVTLYVHPNTLMTDNLVGRVCREVKP